ncbi:MAG: hypothetical protein GF405_03225 [Candidatus Eisenbacteria bacterium]|nr:hypothetical protein [Candidatus Eisenbacteria bacterium]
MAFCTVINCMDGRVQLPVISYLMNRLGVPYVDSVTEPGPVRILADSSEKEARRSVFDRVSISVEKHDSNVIAVVAHADCAGNAAAKEEQLKELKTSVDAVANAFPMVRVIGLWVDESWSVSEITERAPVGGS